MTRMSTKRLRAEMSEALSRVAYGGERIVVERRGRDVAVLVSVDDAAILERIENQIDLEKARRILADPNEKPIPYSRVRKALGLK